jgi:23S rRNA (guanosine2251-2'-O)-methyltransferase
MHGSEKTTRKPIPSGVSSKKKGLSLKTRERERTGKSGSADDWIYGINPLFEAIKAGRTIKKIFLSSGRHEKVPEIRREAAIRNIPVTVVAPAFLDTLFQKGHQGVAASVSPKYAVPLDELFAIPAKKNELPFFLILDCIEDPMNFGALLRVADAAGIHGIVIQSHRSVSLGADVAKVSAGALEYVPVTVVTNIKHAIRELKENNVTIVGADAEAQTIFWDADLSTPVALVVGSEGKGLRQTVSGLCDLLIKIPMTGRINSLNVSVATSICAYEILRQRMQKIE